MKFGRIIYYILHPRKLSASIGRRLRWRSIRKTHCSETIKKEQQSAFLTLGLDFSSSISLLEEVYGRNPRLLVEMESCHHNFFAALTKFEINNILEIGTHSGAGAVLLSELFPSSHIETVDLPDDHPVFASIYGRASCESRRDFLAARDALLGGRTNIFFRHADSTSLTFREGETYDLIWVDGNHEFPYVATDIANCLRLLSDDGWMACDDVRPECSDTLATLNQFANAGYIEYTLIHKRILLPKNLDLVGKYIAIVRKKQLRREFVSE